VTVQIQLGQESRRYRNQGFQVLTTTVPAEIASRALRRARSEVDPGCHLLMTPKHGTVALMLPDRLIGLPHTTVLQLRLAFIACDTVAAGGTRLLRTPTSGRQFK